MAASPATCLMCFHDTWQLGWVKPHDRTPQRPQIITDRNPNRTLPMKSHYVESAGLLSVQTQGIGAQMQIQRHLSPGLRHQRDHQQRVVHIRWTSQCPGLCGCDGAGFGGQCPLHDWRLWHGSSVPAPRPRSTTITTRSLHLLTHVLCVSTFLSYQCVHPHCPNQCTRLCRVPHRPLHSLAH